MEAHLLTHFYVALDISHTQIKVHSSATIDGAKNSTTIDLKYSEFACLGKN